MRGARPGERRGGRAKGTPNKRSLPAIKAAVIETLPHLDSLSLQRYAAAAILKEIENLRSQKRYDARAMVDWLVKLARVAEGYAKLDRGQPDFAEIRADLERLDPDQLLLLKQLSLIASGGATDDTISGGPATPARRTMRNARVDLQARGKVAGTFRRREAGQVRHPSKTPV